MLDERAILHNDNVNDGVINNSVVGPVDNVDKSPFNRAECVEKIAGKLVDLLGSPQSYAFYCQIAYALPEHRIWQNYQTAKGSKRVRSIGGLFNWLCRRDMRKLHIK